VQNAYVFRFVRNAWVRSAVGRVVTWAKERLNETFRPLLSVTGFVGDLLCSSEEQVAENMVLRQ